MNHAPDGRVGRVPGKRAGRGKYDRDQSAEDRKRDQLRLLLLAGAEVFAEEGYARASVGAVLKRSGLSRGTFYAHFEDLEQLFRAVYDEAIEGSRRLQERAMEKQGDPIARLTAAVRVHFQRIADAPALAMAVNRQVFAAGRELQLRREVGVSDLAALLLEGLTAAYATGLIRREADELTCYGLIHAIEAIGMRYVTRGDVRHILDGVPVAVRMVLGAFDGDISCVPEQ